MHFPNADTHHRSASCAKAQTHTCKHPFCEAVCRGEEIRGAAQSGIGSEGEGEVSVGRARREGFGSTRKVLRPSFEVITADFLRKLVANGVFGQFNRIERRTSL